MRMFLKLGLLALMSGTLALAESAPKADRPDRWITTKATIALLTDDNVTGTRVNVETVDGRVTLRGKVETTADRSGAERITKTVEGVTQVRNMLRVMPDKNKQPTNIEDAAVSTSVTAALESDGSLKDSQIRVQSVSEGVVLLAGGASSLSALLRAIQVAVGVSGVRRVTSEVESPDTLTDRQAETERDSEAATADRSEG